PRRGRGGACPPFRDFRSRRESRAQGVSVPHNFRIGVPSKGRLAEIASDLLHEAGLSFRRQERSLFARVREMPVDVTFLRTEDMSVLCAEKAIDMGITGSDLVAESGADVVERLRLGTGQVRLAICVPDDSPITSPGELAG